MQLLIQGLPAFGKVCETPECEAIAGKLLNNINHAINPCDDFYLYACGKKPATETPFKTILDERKSNLLEDPKLKNHGSKVIREMKEKYDKCVEEEIEKDPSKSPKGSEARKSLCNLEATKGKNFAVLRLYADKYFTRTDMNAALKMVSNIRDAISTEVIKNIPWITNDEREELFINMTTLKLNVGYPYWVADDDELNTEYLGVDIFKHLDIWPFGAFELNANYQFSEHRITIPVGYIHENGFDKNIPKYLNYGGLGVTAGHEMSHGVFRWTGDQRKISQNQGRDQALDCIVDQVVSIPNPKTGKKYANATRILNDMLADIGGINASLTAYRKVASKFPDDQLVGLTNFTAEQLFFLKSGSLYCEAAFEPKKPTGETFPGNDHPEAYYRVVIPAMNSPDFAEAFNCPLGSKMNPVQKCRTW